MKMTPERDGVMLHRLFPKTYPRNGRSAKQGPAVKPRALCLCGCGQAEKNPSA